MNKKDKDEFVGLVTEALNDVTVPAFDGMEKRLREDLASKREAGELAKGLKKIESDAYFIRQDIRDIKAELNDMPSKQKFSELKKRVDKHISLHT